MSCKRDVNSFSRVGFISESVLPSITGGLNMGVVFEGDAPRLTSEHSFTLRGDASAAGGVSVTSEFIGNTVPRAGFSFDGSTIFYPPVDVVPEQFISEFTGNYAADRNIIGLTWQAIGNTPPEGIGSGSGGGHTVHPSYRHTQSVSSTVWLIQHDLGLSPVTVSVYVDNAAIEYQVTIVSTNLVRVDLNETATGTALVLG